MKNRLIKNTFLLALVFLLAMISTACSKSASTEKNGPVTLKFFSTMGIYAKGDVGYDLIQEFMQANPNIKVEINYTAKDWLNAWTAMVSSNELPDVYMPGSYGLSDVLSHKWAQPLDGLVSSDFKKIFPAGTFVDGVNMKDGKIYSFPNKAAKTGMVLVYNKQIMEQAGLDPNKPPKTWDELLSMSKRVTQAGKGQYYGMVFPLRDGDLYGDLTGLASALQPTLNGNGFDSQKGRYDFDSPNVTKALNFFFSLKDAGVIDPNSISYAEPDAMGAFANGKAAFMTEWDWIVRNLTTVNKATFPYGIASVPVPEAGMKYHYLSSSASSSLFLSATTKHPKEAAKLIEWLGSDHYYQAIMKDYLLPPIPENSYPSDTLKQLADVYKETLVERPMPETKQGGFEVKRIEASLPAPKPDWWQVVQGAYVGQIKDWQTELKKVNDAYNQRFEQAIKQAQDKGVKVSKSDFAFPDFDGTKDYKN